MKICSYLKNKYHLGISEYPQKLGHCGLALTDTMCFTDI